MESNPHSIKRLVNAYSVNRDLAILAGLNISQEYLAFWTILSLRWTLITDRFEKEPEIVDTILVSSTKSLPQEITNIWDNKEITEHICTIIKKAEFTSYIVKECIKIRCI